MPGRAPTVSLNPPPAYPATSWWTASVDQALWYETARAEWERMRTSKMAHQIRPRCLDDLDSP